ncbi:SH3 domain-containing protein [Nitratireductor sp. GCM10026969]|uniref:SH3 domain-containing protein n=1 Tax=Nitratireductor sp. GCM10026969 TaxID=3252645 RepID=UPI0036161A0F
MPRWARAWFVFVLICMVAIVVSGAPPVSANEARAAERGPSGLPLPRFVSLKSGRVNMRVGPGTSYAVKWLYTKSGLPMEIIQEYDNWRQVRDADGAEGWINQALLSGRRTGIVAPWFKGKATTLPLLARPREDAQRVAEVEPGAIGEVRECDGKWCRMDFNRHTGWIRQATLWGVYPDEIIEE